MTVHPGADYVLFGPGADRNISALGVPSHRLTPAPQQIYGRRRFQKTFPTPYWRVMPSAQPPRAVFAMDAVHLPLLFPSP